MNFRFLSDLKLHGDSRSRNGRNRKEENKLMSAKTSRNHSRIHPLHLLAGVLATGLSVPALLGQSVPFPTYVPGAQTNGTFVAASGQVITPAGTYVNLGTTTRAKAIALNPTGNNTAAVLQMGAPQVVTVFKIGRA